jgi:uncharacterized protein (DUF697 family)
MPNWSEMGAAMSTLRELDVSAIREEAERQFSIACVGDRQLFDQLAALLRAQGLNRHGAGGGDPLFHSALGTSQNDESLRRADLLVLLFDGRRSLPVAETAPLGRLAGLGVPTTVLIVGAATSDELGPPRPEFAHAEIAVVPSLDDSTALTTIAAAILARLPGELHLAAARRLPGLRAVFAEELIRSVSFANASFAVASAIPEQIPILAVPFVAADMIVLTKNQALMVYRVALAYGAQPDFRERMAELAPVIGGGFVWRQLARSLIGLIPIWGVIPKVAVAYAGTYATGVAAWGWFSDSKLLTRERMRQLSDEAMGLGRQTARKLLETSKSQGQRARRGLARLPLPGRRKANPPPTADSDSTTELRSE